MKKIIVIVILLFASISYAITFDIDNVKLIYAKWQEDAYQMNDCFDKCWNCPYTYKIFQIPDESKCPACESKAYWDLKNTKIALYGTRTLL